MCDNGAASIREGYGGGTHSFRSVKVYVVPWALSKVTSFVSVAVAVPSTAKARKVRMMSRGKN